MNRKQILDAITDTPRQYYIGAPNMPGIIERNFKASRGYQSMTGTRPPFGPSDAEELIDKLIAFLVLDKGD
jgi:hypothetical protein